MRRDLLHLFLPQLTVHVDTNKQLKVNRKTTSVQVQLLSTGDAKISSFSSPEVLALSLIAFFFATSFPSSSSLVFCYLWSKGGGRTRRGEKESPKALALNESELEMEPKEGWLDCDSYSN